jgi:hypothetical protein
LSDVLTANEALQNEETLSSKRYLVQRWGSGTLCDMTGLDRTVEVQVRFLSSFWTAPDSFRQFHCNTQSTDKIALIREVSICNYVMVIHTPRLCGEPYFLGSGSNGAASEPSQVISCRPIAKKPSTLGDNDARTTPGYEPEPLSSVLAAPTTTESDTPSPEETKPLVKEDEDKSNAASSKSKSTLFYLDLETGKIMQQEPSKDEKRLPREEENAEQQVEDAQEALSDFAAALERTLAAAMEKGPLGRNKDKASGDEAMERIGQLLKGIANPAIALKKAMHRPGQGQPHISTGEVGNTQHQAMKGLYEEQFDGEEEAKKQKVVLARDEL